MDESGIEATQALDFGDYDDDVTDDEQGENTPVAFLNVACQKGFPGKLFPVYEGDNVIGRGEECKISVPLKALSREHACIEVKGDSHFIYDKGSRNRTRRNNHFLAALVRYELKDKDKLIFGDVECEYQIGSRPADDGDETGSESMFQTAPDDGELDQTVETNEKTEVKPPGEEDYASDASSDVLERTQPIAGNTQSMLGNRTHTFNSTLAQNITVKDTPAVQRSKRFIEDLVLPESGSDTDDEGSIKPPPTLAIAADSQDDDEDDDVTRSRVMGAATQAYVCESDVTTDEEDSMVNKKSLLAAPTQAFLEDDDVSTCSEDSPKKKLLLTAATQAFAVDSDDDKTPSKKQAKTAPTVAYDMDEGIEPTQGYDMDEDTDDEKEEKEEEQKSSGILFEPTQAYLGSKVPEDKDDVDANSDTSEEFVLEGDTDAEDNDDEGEILAAPTLACDEPGGEEDETQVVSEEEPTQVVDENDATVAVGGEATQVFDEPEIKRTGRNRKKKADETLPVSEAETQVFQGNDETDTKPHVINDDATQVFDEDTDDRQEKRKSAESHVAETQIFDEDATQVFDKEQDTKTVSENKRQSDQTAETQVFDNDATQCFDEENTKDSKEIVKQKSENATKIKAVKTGERAQASKHDEMETQVFDKNDSDGAFSDDGGKTFDISAVSTLACNEDVSDESETEEVGVNAGGDDATQVFEEVDSTVAVNDDQTVQVETAQNKAATGRAKNNKVDETVAVAEDATQVFEDKPVQSKTTRGRRKTRETTDDTVAVSDDATQVFDDTVAVGGVDQTEANQDDQTVAVEDIDVKAKSSRRKKTVVRQENNEDATQIFDDGNENETVSVEEIESKSKLGSRRKGKQKGHIAKKENNEDATQVFDETVPVDNDQTVPVEENDNGNKSADKRKGKRKEHTAEQEDNENATQVFDETVAVKDVDSDLKELRTDTKHMADGKLVKKKSYPHEDATQIFEENSDTGESGNKRQKRKFMKSKSTKQHETKGSTKVIEETSEGENVSKNKVLRNKENVRTRKKIQEESTQVIDDIVPVSEEIDVNSEATETNDADSCKSDHIIEEATQAYGKGVDSENEDIKVNLPLETKGKRTRGNRQMDSKNVKETVAKSKVNKKSETVESSEKAEKTAPTNVRKSGRTRGKAAVPENDEELEINAGKQTKDKSDDVKKSKGVEKAGKGKKGGKGKKNVEPDLEPATQVYADSEPSDEIATQRYGDVEDDDLTPDLTPDITPDITEIVDEKIDNVPAVVAEPQRGRSPLKSAMASPKKKKSPSPKKVQFVSQNSETGSESGEPSRRSKRRNRGGQIEAETSSVPEKSQEITRKGTKTVAVPQNKRLDKKSNVNTQDSTETENTEEKSENTEEKSVTGESSVEHETDKTRTSKRQKKGKNVNLEKNIEIESDSKDKNESVESDSKNKAEVNIRSNRRGRKSVDTETNVKQGSGSRNSRTSLPIVLEEIKPDTSQKSGKTKDIQVVDEKENAMKNTGKGKKNIKGKGKISELKEVENKEIEDTEHDLRMSSRQMEIDLKNSHESSTSHSKRDNKDAKRTSETGLSSVSVHAKKSTSRLTRTKKTDTTDSKTEVGEENTSSSQRHSRKKEISDVDDIKVDHLKKKKLDHVKANVEKRDSSPQTLSRTRTRNNETSSSESIATRHSLEITDNVKDNVKGSKLKGKKTETNSSELHDELKEKAEATDDKHKASKGKGDKKTTLVSNSREAKHVDIEEEADIKTKGKAGKGSKGKANKVEPENVKIEQTHEEVNNESKGPTRSKRGGASKAVPKVEKEETPVESGRTNRSRVLKRKESASSSNDSQESDRGETPAKRQKKKKVDEQVSTPKLAGKQTGTVSTPRGASTKQLETSVTHSPTLRKTTVEGSKPKVMFTGVVDEHGEKILKELGGELVSSVTDCTHLVTDQVRRTVKFLCCLSQGVPIVSPQWLVSSKASGFFLDPTPFLVKDEAAERKYKFRLDQSIEKANKDPMFRAFTFKITKSVKPEPQHMKDILKCAGAAKFVDKMPDRPDQILTVVISCPEDQALCEPAYKVGIPVLTAEFVLTGILRQEVDFYSFKLEKNEKGSKRQAASSQETSKKRKR